MLQGEWKMATITKRKSKWQVRIRLSNTPTITKTFNRKSNAKQWAREIENKIECGNLGADVKPTDETLGEVLDKYLHQITPKKKSSVVETIRIKWLMREPIASVQICRLTPQHIAKFRDERLRHVSGTTVLKDLALLSHAITIAVREWGWPLAVNPVKQITKPKPNAPRDRRLEEGEEERLLAACSASRNPYFKALVVVAIETAMRRGELLGLERQYLKINNRTAYLPMTKNGDSRTVPLSTRAIATLNDLPVHISGKVFPLSETALRGLWGRACRRAGIVVLHFHDLRHEATSRLFEKGLNIMEVSAITGHKDPKMLKRYTHLKAEDLALKLG
jgi:integrase